MGVAHAAGAIRLSNPSFSDHVSAIDKHLDADREHAARGLAEIDALWHGKPAYAAMLKVVDEAAHVFEAFCDDVCAQSRQAA